jgi:uncharacterized membrane protein
MISEIIVILIGCVSFILFLIFHHRLAYKQYNKQPTILGWWAFIHIMFGWLLFLGRIRKWINGTDKDFEPVLMIVVFIVTGAIMLLLTRKVEKVDSKKSESLSKHED